MLSITVKQENGQLVLSLPDDAIGAETVLDLLGGFLRLAPEARKVFLDDLQATLNGGGRRGNGRRKAAAAAQADDAGPEEAAPSPGRPTHTGNLTDEDQRYLRLLHEGLEHRDIGMVEFAYADLFALTEARRLKLPLTARQRNSLIQYYIDRHGQPEGGASASIAGLRFAAAFSRKKK